MQGQYLLCQGPSVHQFGLHSFIWWIATENRHALSSSKPWAAALESRAAKVPALHSLVVLTPPMPGGLLPTAYHVRHA